MKVQLPAMKLEINGGKHSSHTFSFGLEIHFCHCTGTGVAGPLICVLVKDHVGLQTVVIKEWGTEDF